MSDNSQKAGKFVSTGGFKIILLIVIVLLLLIPINMIRSLVYERSSRALEAENSIMEAWGGELVIFGPIIRIPVIETVEVRRNVNGVEEVEITQRNQALWITPKDVEINSNFFAHIRRRGIFSVPLFSGDISLTGSFSFERLRDELRPNKQIFPQEAELIISLASQRGIRRIDLAKWNESELFFMPGNRGFSTGTGGINASSPFNITGENTFNIQLSMQGGRSMRIAPIGETTKVNIHSDWISPSFQGSYLPAESVINENGFNANWEISYLSRAIPLFWFTGEGVDGRPNLQRELFGVDFFRLLDHYSLNIRAVKYAILFLIIPFLTLFFLEIFSQKSLHPAQYLITGIANVIFYLLLLSFSEHIPFPFAYLIAANALTIMMTLYSKSLLDTWMRSAYVGLVMILLYLIMYLTLNAEDWALLIGSIAAFGICAVVMFITRKLDWKKLSIKNRE